MRKDYTTYTNEELVAMIASGEEDAYEQFFQNLKPITLYAAQMYQKKMDIYDTDDFVQEGQILIWDLIQKGHYNHGKFHTYYKKAIRNRLASIWRRYTLKNLICLRDQEDDYGNVTRVLAVSDYARKYRIKRAAEQKRYYLKKKASQPPKEKKPTLTREEKYRRVREYQKRYYAEHPEKLEERRAKARLYQKKKRERLKAERLAAKTAAQAVVHGASI